MNPVFSSVYKISLNVLHIHWRNDFASIYSKHMSFKVLLLLFLSRFLRVLHKLDSYFLASVSLRAKISFLHNLMKLTKCHFLKR